MCKRAGVKDSPHWTHTERLYGGVALSSLDVRRAVIAAGARSRRRRWAVRVWAWLAGSWFGFGRYIVPTLRELKRGTPNGRGRRPGGQDGKGRT